MQQVINSLVVLGLVVVVLLTFAVAALLRDVRALQTAMAEVVRPPRRQVPAFAGVADTFVLVVSRHCTACEARAGALARWAPPDGVRAVLLSADAATAAWVAGSAVTAVVDPVLVGELGADVTPLLVHYDATGAERLRRPVGSDADLFRLLDAPRAPDQIRRRQETP